MEPVHPSPRAGRSRRGARFAVAAAVAAGALIATACDATTITLPLGSRGACGSWRTVPSPSVGRGYNSLDGVSIAPDGTVWAVGAYKDSGGVGRSLVLRYRDGSWGRVPTPNIGSGGTFLNDVEAIGADDVWAVGATRNAAGVARTFAMHWNGRAWGAVPTPNFGDEDNFLTDVAVIGPNDIWASGYRMYRSATRSLLLHWTGSGWHGGPFVLRRSTGDGLNAISAAPNGDVWAVGGYSRPGFSTQTLILHWNGNRWRSESSPNVSRRGNTLTGVVGTSDAGAWAVGGFQGFTGDRTLFLSGTDGSWRIHPMPDSRAVTDDLNDVAASSPTDLWAVGTTFDGSSDHTLIMRGNGSGWVRTPSPNAGVNGSRLTAVAASTNGQAWAVGNYFGAIPGRTLIQHFCPAAG
jgi:hypothetical protein